MTLHLLIDSQAYSLLVAWVQVEYYKDHDVQDLLCRRSTSLQQQAFPSTSRIATKTAGSMPKYKKYLRAIFLGDIWCLCKTAASSVGVRTQTERPALMPCGRNRGRGEVWRALAFSSQQLLPAKLLGKPRTSQGFARLV